MNLYTSKQLWVILAITIVMFIFLILKVASKNNDNKGATVFHNKPYVYELRGDIKREGFYCFNEKQSLEELLKVCRGVRNEKRFVFKDVSMKVPNGSRVTFKECLHIEEMDVPARMIFFLPISVNSSSAEDLVHIPGIGIQTAKAIIAYRDKHNGIKDLHELVAIKGLGEKKVQSLLPYLTINR
jgi:competence ComEA-like helix-hairpin-helix protein